MYLCKANSTIYFLNQDEKKKWVNPLNIGNSKKLYPIDDYQNDLMAVPLYKTNYLSWGEEKFFADNRGGIHVFISLSEKEVDHADMFAIYADDLVYQTTMTEV